MTTSCKELVRCTLCDTETHFTSITSTNSFGSPDLDTRPPEMKRSTMFAWVQRCPECGHCAEDVSEAYAQASAVVNTVNYSEQLNNEAYPDLANSFLCKALIHEAADNYIGAAWALIHAAWTCDDAEQMEQAKLCRSRAADMLVKVADRGEKIFLQEGVDTAIHVDLLRRSGRGLEARALIDKKRSSITDDNICKALMFEEHLVSRNDDACYTLAAAVEEYGE